jgi:hypothetical protein
MDFIMYTEKAFHADIIENAGLDDWQQSTLLFACTFPAGALEASASWGTIFCLLIVSNTWLHWDLVGILAMYLFSRPPTTTATDHYHQSH